MKVGLIAKLGYRLIGFSLLFFICLTNIAADANTQIYKTNGLCTLKGFDCFLLSAKQDQHFAKVFLDIFHQSNEPLINNDFKKMCQSGSQFEKKLITSDKSFQKKQQTSLNYLMSDVDLGLVDTKRSSALICTEEGVNKSAAIGVLACALIGFVILSNKRRV